MINNRIENLSGTGTGLAAGGPRFTLYLGLPVAPGVGRVTVPASRWVRTGKSGATPVASPDNYTVLTRQPEVTGKRSGRAAVEEARHTGWTDCLACLPWRRRRLGHGAFGCPLLATFSLLVLVQ